MGNADRHSYVPGALRRVTAGVPQRPRVLFLACHLPWPPISGGRRRELELIRRVSARFDVHLVVVSKTPADDRCNASELAEACCCTEVFAADPIVGEIPGGECAQVMRHRSRAASRRVWELLATERIDLVHVEGFYLLQHVPWWVEPPVLLVEQNVEFELERQRSRYAGGGLNRSESFERCARTRESEVDAWRRATRLATATWEDRESVRAEFPGARVSVVPDGADHIPHYRTIGGIGGQVATEGVAMPWSPPTAPLVVLLANFAYAPNVDAAGHLVHDILPAVTSSVPDVHVWLVGNEPPADVRALAEDRVLVTGYVPDVVPYLDAADVIACPLRIGGGIKVKMIDALRRGKAIVSTSIGAQGLPRQARQALLIADEPREFAQALSTLLLDDRQRARLQLAAGKAAHSLPSWDDSARALTAIYDELIAHPDEMLDAVPALAEGSG